MPLTEAMDAGGIEFSPDGRLLAVVGAGGIVSLVNADTGDEEQPLMVPDDWCPPEQPSPNCKGLLNVAFSPDGSRVAAAPNFGGPAPVWDVETGRVVLELDMANGGYVTGRTLVKRLDDLSGGSSALFFAWQTKVSL